MDVKILVLVRFSETRVFSQMRDLNDFFPFVKGKKRTWANPMSSKQWRCKNRHIRPTQLRLHNLEYIYVYIYICICIDVYMSRVDLNSFTLWRMAVEVIVNRSHDAPLHHDEVIQTFKSIKITDLPWKLNN